MSAASSHLASEPTAQTRAIRSFHFAGPAGRLEAVLNQGQENAACSALICHPHPLHGGTLHNKVVYHAMKVLNAPVWGFNFPVLRFNFRGTGSSEGQYDGHAEVQDVNAALDWLDRQFHLPIVLVGFSFGAAMALNACCGPQAAAHNIRALIALGLPIHGNSREYSYSFLHNSDLPKLFLSGDQDNFASADELTQIATAAPGPARLQLIPGADHFFTGQLKPMQQALGGWLEEQFRDPSQ